MSYKFPFFILAIGILVAGIIPIGMSQVPNQTEPSMEIDMLSGQTQNPFRIQNSQNQDVFRVNVDGTIFPSPILFNEMTVTPAFYDEIINQLDYADPDLLYVETAETGAGIYQYEYTIQPNQLPSGDSMNIFSFDKPLLMFSATSENVSGGIADCNMKVFIDDSELTWEADNSIASGSFWMVGGTNADDAYTSPENILEVGDVIGVKIWAVSGTNDCELKHIYMGSVPRIQINAITVSVAGFTNLGSDNEIAPNDPFTSGTIYLGWSWCTWRDGTWENTGSQVNRDISNGDWNKGFVHGDYWYCDTDGDAYNDIEVVGDQHLFQEFSGANNDALFTDEPNALKWSYVNDGS